MRPSSTACFAALAALTDPPQRASEAHLHAEHRARCLPCREAERLFAEVERSLEASDEALDDLTRARVLARLGSSLDRVAHEPRLPRRRSWIPVAAAGVALVLIGVALALSRLAGPGTREQHARAGNAVIVPFAVERELPGMLLGQRVHRLKVPEAIVVRALLDERAVIALAGPAELEVTRAESGHLELELKRGTLVASYDRSKGGRLLVRAPGASAEVIGTLFLVEVDAVGRTVVAVAHGRVQVRPQRGAVLALGDRRRWSEREGAGAITSRQIELFERLAVEPATQQPRSERHAEKRTSSLAPSRRARATVAMPSPAPRPTLALEPEPLRQPTSAPATAPASATTAVVRDSAALRYARAEAAMRGGDRALARRVLEELVRSWPRDPLASQARYELARLALAAGELAAAARALDLLLSDGAEQALKEPAAYLRCRIDEREGKRAKAVTCLERFRARFPRSPHDPAALAALILWSNSCGAVARLGREYLARYPEGAHLAAVRDRLTRCTR